MLIALIVSVTIIGITHLSAELSLSFEQLADIMQGGAGEGGADASDSAPEPR